MTDTINGRTPEEIKRRLGCLLSEEDRSCDEHADCFSCSFRNAVYIEERECYELTLAYIQQLERERDEARNDLDTLNYANTELHSAYEAMKRERDAAVEQLSGVHAATPMWTPVYPTTMPEPKMAVLTCGLSIQIGYSRGIGEGWFTFDDKPIDNVRFWMPLPRPPKGV